MARIFGEGSGKGVDAQPTHLDVNDSGAVRLPDGIEASSCELTRDGQDLVMTTPDGEVFIVENYFAMADAPVIISDSGALLSPALVLSFIKPAAGDVQVAATEQANDASPVGEVTEVSGEATVTHADGSKEKISSGTQIFEGDIVETDAKGAVNIKFADDSTFAVSENARLAVDDFSFNAADQSGTTGVSILRGVFMFTSGLIGRENPDAVTIETPVGSIGIRGTIIGGNIAEGGKTTISVIEGAIVVRNGTGEQILSQQFETVTLTAFSQPIVNVGTMNAGQMTQTFGSVRSVSPTLFTSIDDTSRDASQPDAQQQQQTQPETQQQQQTQPEAQPQSNNQPAAAQQPAAEQAALPEAPVQPALTQPTVFQTLTTGSNIENSLGAHTTTTIAAPVQQPDLPPITAPQNTPAPVVVAPPVTDTGDRRAPSSVAFVSGGTYNENNSVGAEVGKVALTDSTMKFPVKFEFVNSVPFTIDADGRIFATTRGNYEADPHDYNMTIRVTRLDTNQTSETPLTIHLTNVDEAPKFDSGSSPVSVNEGEAVILTAAMLKSSDPENDTLSYRLTAEAKGQIQVDRGGFAALAVGGTFTAAELAAGKVKYLHTGDEPGGASFSLVTLDPAGHESSEKQFLVDISGQNDAPTEVISEAGSIQENAAGVVISDTMLNQSDPDNTPEQILYIVSNITHGTLTRFDGTNNVVLGTNDSFTQADINNGHIRFTQNGDENAQAGFSYSVGDGIAPDAGVKDFHFTVTNVNDAPVLEYNTSAMDENATLVLTSDHLQYSDAENNTLTYTVTSVNHGVVRLDGANLTAGGTFTQNDINNGRISFVQNGDENDTASFNYTVTDGIITTPINGTFTADVTNINDAASAPVIHANVDFAERTGGAADVLSELTITDGETPVNNAAYSFNVLRFNGTSWVNDNTQFEVHNSGAGYELRVRAGVAFDHETQSGPIRLKVELTDGANPTVTSNEMVIAITDVNEAATSFTLNKNIDFSAGADIFMEGKHQGAVLGILKSVDIDTLATNHPTASNYKILSTNVAALGLSVGDFEIIDRMRDGKLEIILKLRDGVEHEFNVNDSFDITIQLDADQNSTFDGAGDLSHTYSVLGRNDTMILEFVNGSNGFRVHNDVRNGAMFGSALTVGDYDGNGTPDLVFGAPRAVAPNTQVTGGFYGLANSANLITHIQDGNVNLSQITSGSPSESFFREFGDANAFFGAQLAVIKDFSGTQNALAVADPKGENVRIFLDGSTTGMISIHGVETSGSPTFTSITLGSVGDINGDGFNDLLVGSPTDSTGAAFSGSISLFTGSPDQSGGSYDYVSGAAWHMNGAAAGDNYGSSITALGDFNGDGKADFAVGSSNADTNGGSNPEVGQGRVTVYFGSNNFGDLSTNKLVIDNLGSASAQHFGSQIIGVGDFNGDHLDDMMIRSENSVALVYGSTSLQSQTVNMANLNTGGFSGALITSPSMTTADKIGSISSAGDFNGDGYDDVAIDFAKSMGGGQFEHTVFVVYGSASGAGVYNLDTLRNSETGAFKIRLLAPSSEMLSITNAGDFNGDGYNDLLIGNQGYSNNGTSVQDGSATMVYGNNHDGKAIDVLASETASAGNQAFVGNMGDNTVNTGGFSQSSFSGGAGDDTLVLKPFGTQADYRHFNGGAGKDALMLFFSEGEVGAQTDIIDLRGMSKYTESVETIIFDSTSKMDTLRLDIKDVLNLANSNDDRTLTISSGGTIASDANFLQIFNGGTTAGSLAGYGFTNDKSGTPVGADIVTDTHGNNYYAYTHNSGVQLLVDVNISNGGALIP